MPLTSYLGKSFLHALGVLAYIGIVVALLSNAEAIFGQPENPEWLIPIFMLLLFIISATITSLLVLGRPIQWYWEGKKKEAVTLLVSILGWLIVFWLIVAGVLIAR